MLNQVENLDWARELLADRWFTWHQPPGWSPLLAVASLTVSPDLPGGNALFLWVLLLVGLSSVRLSSLLAPRAPVTAWLVPAGMVAAHGLLMIEPMSTNFPDSLYAASVLAVAIQLAQARDRGFGLMALACGMLRWPGLLLAAGMAAAWRLGTGQGVGRALRHMGTGLIAAIAMVGAGLLTGIVVGGSAQELGFILWFETVPEHWHGDHQLGSLAPRVPGFYGLWLQYTGGGLLLAALGLLGAPSQSRRHLGFLLGSALAYSLLLCTIDHHPTHYFLPLLALTGPAVVASADSLAKPALRHGISTLCLLGLWIFLCGGQV
jgi:hypothetical protein